MPVAKLKNYITETRKEMRYVNWPNRQQTVRFTLLVVGISASVAAFLGFADFFFGYLLNAFIL